MKNKYIKTVASALCTLALAGCADLDTVPLGSIVTSDQKEQVVAADPSKVQASVTAITSNFYIYGNSIPEDFGHDDYGYPSIMLSLDSRGMDMPGMATGYNWHSEALTYADCEYDQRTPRVIWTTLYNQIYTANAVTALIDAETEDPDLQFYLAQAYAIRAFDYFVLAQLFQFNYVGHENSPCVPLITEVNSDEAASVGCARATVQEVYDQVLGDLNNAISLLERSGVTRSDKRYVSREVAYGIRARVYLTMQRWAEAAADAQTVISDSGATPYSRDAVSVPGFTELTDPSWLWGIYVAETDRVVTSGIVNFPSHMGSLNYGYATVGAWRKISEKLYNSIPATDVRKGWWLDENAESPNLSDPALAEQAVVYGCPPYSQVKYGPYKNVPGQSVNASDIPLMRIEEMYLILAEAQAMSGSASAGASTLQDFVTTYRDPAYTCTATTATGVQDAVWQQRRIELWGEGLSWFDLMRLGKGVDRRGAGFPEAYVFNIEPTDNVLIYRIPQKEEEANPLISSEDNNPVTSRPTAVPDN